MHVLIHFLVNNKIFYCDIFARNCVILKLIYTESLLQDLEIPAFNFSFAHETATSIVIQNCHNVSIGSNSIDRLRNLRHLYMYNIQNLRLHERSFNWRVYYGDQLENLPQLAVTISNTRLKEIPTYTFSGTLSELRLENVVIDTMLPYAFSSIEKLRIIELKHCHIKQMQAQALKKIKTESFLISDTRFGTLPSRAIVDVEVTEMFRLVNCDVDTIRPSGIIINSPRIVEILNSRFNDIESDAFRIRSRGKILIKNNTFLNLHAGVFKGISLITEPRSSVTSEVLFINNVLSEFNYEAIAFNRSSFTVTYQSVIINKTCACAEIQTWNSGGQRQEEIHCVIDNRPMRSTSVSAYYNGNCKVGSNFWLILGLVIAALVVFLIILVGIIVYFYRRYRAQKQKEYVNRGRTKNGSLGLIVPDGRTYKETEVHVIVEKAELLTTEL